MREPYRPTSEQASIIAHDGDAFVRACPGAGKTRTMVERARVVLADNSDRRGVAFLSFTNAAVEELTARLVSFGALPSPLFPSFIGTFDRFLWQFLIAPFGVEGCDVAPRLVPDKSKWIVQPYDNAQSLTLDCFDRVSASLIKSRSDKVGFVPKNGPRAWETSARKMLTRSMAEGRLDFDDVRACVVKRLADKSFASTVGAALAGRFREIVVDEAQDCNPSDLEIVAWLRASGLAVKIICDPNQGIYGFRGGVTNELITFAGTFDGVGHLPMSGNFRSTPAICAAIGQLRPPSSRGKPDQALGRYRTDYTPVHLLSYGGVGVPAAIGAAFEKLIEALGIELAKAPVLASTWASASNAAGRKAVSKSNEKTLILAQSVMGFLSAFEAGNRREALVRLHRAVLLIRGDIENAGEYGRYLDGQGDGAPDWRAEIIGIGQGLRPESGETGEEWLKRAHALLAQGLKGSRTIGRQLRRHTDLDDLLATTAATGLPAGAIHSVKGREFPAVCVVLTAKRAGTILDVLDGANTDPDDVEEARKIYVAASRAERLLAFATPRSRVDRLKALLEAGGVPIVVSQA